MYNESLTDLGGFKPVIDETTGEITGYKTTIGGADTVFPFSNTNAEIVWTNTSPDSQIKNTVSFNFDFTKYDYIVILIKAMYDYTEPKTCQIFETSGTGGTLACARHDANYNRSVSFDKDNNTVSIKPSNSSAGNYYSYTIPERAWGLKIDADFTTWN